MKKDKNIKEPARRHRVLFPSEKLNNYKSET